MLLIFQSNGGPPSDQEVSKPVSGERFVPSGPWNIDHSAAKSEQANRRKQSADIRIIVIIGCLDDCDSQRRKLYLHILDFTIALLIASVELQSRPGRLPAFIELVDRLNPLAIDKNVCYTVPTI